MKNYALKIIFSVIFFNLSIFSFLFSQEDSIHSLFPQAKVTSLYWDEGYSGIFQKNNLLQGGTLGYLCLVLNEKIAMGVGSDLYGHDINTLGNNNVILDPNTINSIKTTYLKLEYLIKPHRVINFSFPLKFCFTKAGLYDTIAPSFQSTSYFNGKNYYYHSDHFFMISPGVNVLVNLFKQLSFGLGADYNIAVNVNYVGSNADYSKFSFFAFIRIKLDVIAYQKKAEENQRLFWGKYNKQ